MDDDDADYMQGSDDVSTARIPNTCLDVLTRQHCRTMASITLEAIREMRRRVLMSRTCIILPSVGTHTKSALWRELNHL